MATHEMSRIEMELNNMNTTSDESSVMTVNESEQKTITALDELLQRELKEVDPVDCFIKRVGHASEDSSEFGLNYVEAPVETSSAFYSPKEDTSTDNNSLLEEELEDPLKNGKEEILTGDTDKLPSGEEAAAVKDDTPVINTSVECTEGTKETEDKGEDDTPHKNDSESVEIQEKENSMIFEDTDSEVKDQVDNKDSAVEEETKEKETDDEAKEKELGDEIKEKETSDETKEKESCAETMGTELGDNIKEKEVSDEAMKTETSDETKEKETGDDVQEIPNTATEQTEKDTNNESTKCESTKEVQKDALYLVFHPKGEVNTENDSGIDNKGPVLIQSSETLTSTSSAVKTITVSDKPITKAVFSISTGGEAKNGKEINKSIIVKKITAKIIKTGNKVTLKPANESDGRTKEGILINTKSSQPEEKPQSNSSNTNEGELEKPTQNDVAAAVKVGSPETILTRTIYGRRKSPKKGQVSNTKDKDATNNDTQHHLNNANDDKKSVLINEVKTKRRAGNRGKTLSDKPEVNGKEKGENVEKRSADCGTLKRKFEEICRISREEEDAAIKEIKKMKNETLVVLKKINAEMEKLKLAFLARK